MKQKQSGLLTSTGALCGSQYVNENFLEWFKAEAADRTGSFEDFCEQYSITEAACLKKAESEFETLKREFIAPKKASDFIIFRGKDVRETLFEITRYRPCIG